MYICQLDNVLVSYKGIPGIITRAYKGKRDHITVPILLITTNTMITMMILGLQRQVFTAPGHLVNRTTMMITIMITQLGHLPTVQIQMGDLLNQTQLDHTQ